MAVIEGLDAARPKPLRNSYALTWKEHIQTISEILWMNQLLNLYIRGG